MLPAVTVQLTVVAPRALVQARDAASESAKVAIFTADIQSFPYRATARPAAAVAI
jgi:hypothetical protein